MKLVIDIDDTTYDTIKNSTFFIKGGRGSGRTIENNILMAIYEGKPLEQETETVRWIPVSERLPEMAFGCLVTVEEDDKYGEPQSVLYPEFVGYDGETWNNADGEPIPFEVIAWMPLPKAYKPQEREVHNDI